MFKNALIAITLLSSLYALEEVTYENGYRNCNSDTNGERTFLSETIYNINHPVVFDVGANVGDWTNITLQINPLSTVYAFEPGLRSFVQLLKLTEINNQVKCFHTGFSNKIDTNAIFYTYGDFGAGFRELDGLYDREVLHAEVGKPTAISVQLTTIDAFCEENSIEHIDLLKIDTEGEEYKIFLGALNTLDSGIVDSIQFEYGGCYIDSKSKLEDIYFLLIERGYKVYRLLPNGKKYIGEWKAELENYEYSNYVAIRKK